MLDYRDQVIFEHLLANARTQNKELARTLRCSEATIVKRVKRLEEEGYIDRYDALINWQEVPLEKAVYFLNIGERSRRALPQITKDPSVFTICSIAGDADWQVWCFFRTRAQRRQFEGKIRPYLRRTLRIRELIFPQTAFFDIPLHPLPTPAHPEPTTWNETSVALMKHMAQGHGRQSLYEMSQQLDIPYDRVHYQGKKLLSSDSIGRIVAQPGNARFGLQTTVLVLRLKIAITSGLWDRLSRIKRVRSLSRCEDGKSIMVHINSSTQKELLDTFIAITQPIQEHIDELHQYVWMRVPLNNRYPLEYVLKKGRERRSQTRRQARSAVRSQHTSS